MSGTVGLRPTYDGNNGTAVTSYTADGRTKMAKTGSAAGSVALAGGQIVTTQALRHSGRGGWATFISVTSGVLGLALAIFSKSGGAQRTGTALLLASAADASTSIGRSIGEELPPTEELEKERKIEADQKAAHDQQLVNDGWAEGKANADKEWKEKVLPAARQDAVAQAAPLIETNAINTIMAELKQMDISLPEGYVPGQLALSQTKEEQGGQRQAQRQTQGEQKVQEERVPVPVPVSAHEGQTQAQTQIMGQP